MTDENTLVMPPAWRRARHPRRDRPGAPKSPPVDRAAPANLRAHADAARADIERIVALPGTDAAAADAVRAHLRGAPDPLGAAVIAHLIVPLRSLYWPRANDLFVDAWIAEHGVAFAARACADLNGYRTDHTSARSRHWTGVRSRRPDETHTAFWGNRDALRRVRTHLAAAPGDVYADAVDGLAARRGHLVQRLVTAYLAPTRHDWVDDLCASGGATTVDPYERWMLFCALGRPHQPAALVLPLGDHDRDLEVIASLVDGVGAEAALPMLIEALDATPDWNTHTVRRLLGVLGHLPLDGAFRAIADRLGRAGAELELQSAARRSPARAMRLLPGPSELLTAHVRARPDLAEAVLPTLPAEAREPIRAILADDSRLPAARDLPPPLTDAPRPRGRAKVPAVPDWADPHLLPQLVLRDGAQALPAEAVAHVLAMLAMSKPDDAHAGVRAVRDLCTPDSVAEFGWALFLRWRRAGDPSGHGWAFTQLALTGGDETVRRLTPVIRAWPGEAGHAKAVRGLDVLAAIGTGTALTHLHSISQRVRYRGLKNRARAKMAEVAAGLGLSADELADRLVPDFGLDADGALILDYGPRRFTVGFDERLVPFVRDASGEPRKSLPKPAAKDDPELAPAAHKRFAALKKDVRTVAADQARRLETAMVTRRRWPAAEWRELLAGHPLLRHLVRRLVWQVLDDAGGGDGPAFRVAEDGTFADAADETVTLPDAAHVRVPHPIDLGPVLPAWTEVFADYAIAQPFPQLARPVHALTAGERASDRLARFEGVRVPAGAVAGLLNRGWERGDMGDAGIHDWFSRRLPGGRGLMLGFEPGIAVSMPLDGRFLTLSGVSLNGRFGDLDAVLVSELLTDLLHLTAPTNGTPR
ncbi:DUF4132 domain-containing protein [Actinomadura algeriensis]|uniref:DUF4132 domain-containing protein n=1 Tax=Actinomadura algeriensis TaxID=1679523 RepID=A0ABR9K3U7_9ACTN|nr:DUF4132 domain-containing protein [Actinomadura algeriensis]MBE1537273.1 hypothetical protein [Actinomadura algeriensis]